MFFILISFFFTESKQNVDEKQTNRVEIYGNNMRYEGNGCDTAGIAVFDKLATGSKIIRYNESRLRKIKYTKLEKISDQY